MCTPRSASIVEQPGRFGQVDAESCPVATERQRVVMRRQWATRAVRGGERGEVEGAEPHTDRQIGGRRANAAQHGSGERRAAFEVTAETPRTFTRREQLVQQVAVTVLDVDEGEPGLARQARRVDERGGELVELVVADRFDIVRADDVVEQSMVVRDHRLRRAGRSREPTGVRQLQPDEQVVGPAERTHVLVHQRGAQCGQLADGGLGR